MKDIRCLILDVDGTLTDGMLYVDPQTGGEMRAFNVHDGFAIKAFQDAGGVVVICSGKGGGSIEHRAAVLGVGRVIQASRDKVADLECLLDELGLAWSQAAMVGDDLPDAPVMRRCGVSFATANARDEVKAVATHVTQRHGGDGAVREVIERIMTDSGAWRDLLKRYELEPAAKPQTAN